MTSATRSWSLRDAPRLDGRHAVVTGGTGGLGYEVALGLARRGAAVVIASRDPARGDAALARLRRALPADGRFGTVRFMPLDLGRLESVRGFAQALADDLPALDILVNNAAVMGLRARETTPDGFERQFGTNYLGHFALTGRLLRLLLAAPGGSRVVSVSSLAHRRARLDLDDLQAEHGYAPMRAYARSKLALLVFALELQRRSQARGWRLASLAAHPGWAATDIIRNGPGQGTNRLAAGLARLAFNAAAQSPRDGALPLLYAAMDPAAEGGGYYGPDAWGETRGAPAPALIMPQAHDPALANRLWRLSETLTGADYEGLA